MHKECFKQVNLEVNKEQIDKKVVNKIKLLL